MQQFYKTLRAFGTIHSFKVQLDTLGRPVGHAVIRYNSADAAKALVEMQKLKFGGEMVSIEKFKTPAHEDLNAASNIFVKLMPLWWD